MRRHTNSPMAWHTKFLAEWGLSQDDPLSVEHALLCKILELAVCYDQVNLGELAHLELAARRLQLVEEKVMERALAASANKGKDKDKGKTSFDDPSPTCSSERARAAATSACARLSASGLRRR